MPLILEPADRPRAVSWFEWLSISIIVYECAVSEAPWLAVLANALLTLWIIVAVSRQRSRVARWFLTVLNAIFYAVFLFRLTTDELGLEMATVGGPSDWAVTVLDLATFWLLWSRPMSEWIASRPTIGTRSKV